MQKQDGRGVLRAGFAVKDVQVIRTERAVTHGVGIRNGRTVGGHFLDG
jgi:hypothetical protein